MLKEVELLREKMSQLGKRSAKARLKRLGKEGLRKKMKALRRLRKLYPTSYK